MTRLARTSKSRAPMRRPAEKSGRLHDGPGRIAQRESVPFTRERSKVRSLVRPPRFAKRLRVALPRPIMMAKRVRRSAKSVDGPRRLASALSEMSKTTPCTVADGGRIDGIRIFRINTCSVGQNRSMMASSEDRERPRRPRGADGGFAEITSRRRKRIRRLGVFQRADAKTFLATVLDEFLVLVVRRQFAP